MAPDNERRRQRKNKKKKATAAERTLTGLASIHDLPIDLLKAILLRIDSSLWLIRAAFVCKLWRGVITAGDDDGNFLRLSRALHPPAIVGYYCLDSDPRAFVPTSPTVVGALHVRLRSLGFLPSGRARWKVADCHGGLVLLLQPNTYFPDLIVCDPLTRRYQGIIHPWAICPAAVYLLDGDADGGGVSMSNFRVLYMFCKNGQPKACVFSTAEAGDWRLLDTMGKDLGSFTGAHLAGRLDDGSLCLSLQNGRVMVLDNASLEFFQLDLPNNREEVPLPGYQSYYRATCP
ncbi:unnamed protein product [Urochloa humidicola]